MFSSPSHRAAFCEIGLTAIGVVAVAYIGRKLPFVNPYVLLGFVVLAVGSVIAALKIELAILGFVLISDISRFYFSTGTRTPIPVGMALLTALLCLWLMRMLMMREVRLVPLSVNKPLLGLSITAVYSVLSSRTFWDPAVKMTPHFWRPQLGGAGAIVLSAGALLLVANCLRETKWIKAVWAIVVSLGAISTINFFTPFPIWIRGAHQVWVVCFAFSQCLFNQKLPLWQRLLLLALAGAWVYRMAVVWTAWISGWFPMVAAIFVMSLLKSRRLALFLVMAMVVFVLLNRQVFYEKVILESDRTGDTKRLDIWRDVIRVSSRNPLLGLGPGGYRTYRVVYGNAPNLDWSIPSHNNYVDIFAQTGLLGLAFFLWFIAAALRDGFELMRRTEEKTFEGAFVRGVVGGFIGMLLISMVGDWLIPYIYNQSLIGFQFTVYTWIALGCMLSIYNETFNRNR